MWPVKGCPTGVPVTGSHNRTVPSSLPEARRVRPSGNGTAATANTPPVWPAKGGPTGVPVTGSHNRTVPSSLPEARRVRPSGNGTAATANTLLVWPVKGCPTGVPVTGSHNRTVPSSLPEARRVRPSGSGTAATATTLLGVAGQGLPDGGAGDRIPQPDRPIGAAGGQEGPPVRQRDRRHRPHPVGVAGQHPNRSQGVRRQQDDAAGDGRREEARAGDRAHGLDRAGGENHRFGSVAAGDRDTVPGGLVEFLRGEAAEEAGVVPAAVGGDDVPEVDIPELGAREVSAGQIRPDESGAEPAGRP